MPQETTSQRLLMPYREQVVLTGYRTYICLRIYGYLHEGLDIACRDGSGSVLASGRGIVVAAGPDNRYGASLCVLYPSCRDHAGNVRTLIARYMHMQQVLVKTGDVVTPGMPVGIEGCAGTGQRHTHMELDESIECPCRTPQVAEGHTFWLCGEGSTVDPALWLWRGEDQCIRPPECDTSWLGFTSMQLCEDGNFNAAG